MGEKKEQFTRISLPHPHPPLAAAAAAPPPPPTPRLRACATVVFVLSGRPTVGH